MAPVIHALRSHTGFAVPVLATAQHRGMLDQVLERFDIKPDFDLDLMQPNQSLNSVAGRLLSALDDVFDACHPDAALVQGDTTTVLGTAIACFHRHIPIGHVEAGLRTRNLQNPFPEEANRVLTSRLSTWHFTPTQQASQNLLDENIPAQQIIMTGNTVIDALKHYTEAHKTQSNCDSVKRQILVTCHRRENFGAPITSICNALRSLALSNPDVDFIYPVHPNPNVHRVAHETLSDLANFRLSPPLDYFEFIEELNKSTLVLTDSGGVQEEAPALGKPVLVLRTETERPEAVALGVAKLIGTSEESIVLETQHLLDDKTAYNAMARGISPYGDGLASSRIVTALLGHFARQV